MPEPRNDLASVYAEAHAGQPAQSDDLASVYAGADLPNQPDTHDADVVREHSFTYRLLRGAGNVLGGVVDLGKNVMAPIVQHADFKPMVEMTKQLSGLNMGKEAWDAAQRGDWGEAARNAALANPFGAAIAGTYETIGNKLGMKDYAGAAGDLAAQALLLGGYKGAGHLGDAVEGTAGRMARAGIQEATMPNKWFRDLPQPVQESAYSKMLANRVKPNIKGVEQASSNVDALTKQIRNTVSQNAGQRLPMDQLDEIAYGLKNRPAYNTSPAGVQAGLDQEGANLRRIKFEQAQPHEIAAARKEIADAANAKAQLLAKPGETPVTLTPDDITDAQVKAIRYPSTISAEEMANLKKNYQDSLTNRTGQMVKDTAVDSIIGDVAASARKTLIDAFPELKSLGADDRDWINIERVVKEAANRSGNRYFKTGLAGAAFPVMAATGHVIAGGKAMLLGGIWRDPQVRAAVASGLSRYAGTGNVLSTAIARMDALATEAEAVSRDNDAKAQSRNAKP